jgi:hypothetical protein
LRTAQNFRRAWRESSTEAISGKFFICFKNYHPTYTLVGLDLTTHSSSLQ